MTNWLVELLGAGSERIVSFVLLLLLILVSIFIGVIVFRRLIKHNTIATKRTTRTPRLSVMDATAIDNRRHLVLVRRDEVEHLILIGGPTDLVIEQNIVHATRVSSRVHTTERVYTSENELEDKIILSSLGAGVPTQSVSPVFTQPTFAQPRIVEKTSVASPIPQAVPQFIRTTSPTHTQTSPPRVVLSSNALKQQPPQHTSPVYPPGRVNNSVRQSDVISFSEFNQREPNIIEERTRTASMRPNAFDTNLAKVFEDKMTREKLYTAPTTTTPHEDRVMRIEDEMKKLLRELSQLSKK